MPKISALPAASELQNADLFAIVQNNTTKKIVTSLVVDFMSAHVTITDANFSGTLAMNHGGTNKALVAANGAIAYTDSNSFELLAPVAIANKILLSGSNAAPSWSVPTYPGVSGASGKILTSDGTNIVYSSTTFPTTIGASGTIIRSNGTDWVASTSTFADTYTINNILYASAGNTVTGLATANNGALITSAGGVPSISSTLPNAVQDNITRLGTIVSGVWNGSVIGAIYGGTSFSTYALGDTIYASAANTLSKLAGNITAVKQYLSQTGTGAVSAAPVWATIDGGDITGYALSKVDDTNVTLTLGGTPLTALLRAASITAGWTGVLSLARGGTNKAITASNGAIVYSDADSFELSAVGSAGQILQSSGAGAPAWSTPTYPSTSGTAGKILRSDGTNNVYSTSTFADTYAINSIPYASAANTITALAPALSSVLISSAASTGVPTWSGALTDGQLIIGSTGATPVVANLTAGTGITIGNAAGAITINATGGGLATATIAGTSQSAAVNTQYIALNAGQTTLTLPATYAVGDIVKLIGATANTGGWIVATAAGDTIRYLNATTSAGGTLTSAAVAGQVVEMICDVANTSWVVVSTVNTTLTTA